MLTETSAVERVRAFNRFYTRVIGMLDAGLVGTSHSLAEARVIYELATRDGAGDGELRRDLQMDGGHLSRVLGRLADRGLVTRERSADDARRQVARLTGPGRDAFRTLNDNQADAVRTLLAPLDGESRGRLVSAMERVHRELDGPADRPSVVLRAPEPGDLGWVVSRNGALYADEFGWDATYEALVARIVADFAADPDPRAAAWIAELDGERAGCVFCVPGGEDDPETARLRLLLVEPSARGHGIGSRLVNECLRFARRTGHRRITLWTNDVLVAARAVYRRADFQLVDENPHHSFGKDLVGQNWARDL